MALKPFVNVKPKGLMRNDILGYWELAAGDTAEPFVCPRFSDKTVQMAGTWTGAAQVAMKCTLFEDLTNFQPAYDPEGTDIVQFADRKVWIVFPNVVALKPELTNGDVNTTIKIVVLGRGGHE